MVIRKIGPNKYGLYSLASGRKLGTFKSKAAAIVRERQIQYFKYKKKGRRSFEE